MVQVREDSHPVLNYLVGGTALQVDDQAHTAPVAEGRDERQALRHLA
jgi:hypothetical protein